MTPARFDQSLSLEENIAATIDDHSIAGTWLSNAQFTYLRAFEGNRDLSTLEYLERAISKLEQALSKARDARHQLSQETRKL